MRHRGRLTSRGKTRANPWRAECWFCSWHGPDRHYKADAWADAQGHTTETAATGPRAQQEGSE